MTKQEKTRLATRKENNDGWQDIFRSTGTIYIIEFDIHPDVFIGDFEIDAMLESWPEQIRATRQSRKQEGIAVAKLPDHSLRDKVLIAFGPEVSAQQAIAALEQATQNITINGLLIGNDPEGNVAWEQLNGQVIV